MSAVAPTQILPSVPAVVQTPAEFKKTLIKDIALNTIRELSVSLAFAAVTCIFVATSAGMLVVLTTTVQMVALNLITRAIGAIFAYRAHTLETIPHHPYEKKGMELIADATSSINANRFSKVYLGTVDYVVHEGSHAMTAAALYQKARPKIEIFPWGQGAVTSYSRKTLSTLGNYLGSRKCDLLTTLAGPLGSVLVATINLIAWNKFKDSHPELSKYFAAMVITSTMHNISYANKGFEEGSKGDFAILWKNYGIHPYRAIGAIILLPILGAILYAGVAHLLSNLKKNPAPTQPVPSQPILSN